MKFLCAVLAIAILLCGAPLVTQALLERVDAVHGRFAKARFKALGELLEELRFAPALEQLKQVNSFFNRVRYKEDKELYGVSDYWATPYEFLGRDAGDCEDFVIAKYFALVELGISRDKLYFTYVRIQGREEAHMVLTYFETKDSIPLVLDNFNKRLLPVNFTPTFPLISL